MRAAWRPASPSVHARFERDLDGLHDDCPQVAQFLEAARDSILAFTVFPERFRTRPVFRDWKGTRGGRVMPSRRVVQVRERLCLLPG